jgi:gamma-glutamylcyclotransferase (GGCT)/AIG2-like uncharacterized protein YtfP
MIEKSDYLFVYGTLLDEQNEFAIYLKKNCCYYSKGRFQGRLYDFGEYPGAIAEENCTNYVYGSIIRLKNISKDLKYLDDYEGFGEEQEQPNLFVRTTVEVETESGKINCWVYLYNLRVDGFKVIESGDYITYKSL